MSLQVWMPMNGDLTLKGCQSFVPKVSGTISFANSNMGQCLCCSGQVIIPAQKVAKIFNNTAMTVAFWYNNNGGATASHPICGFGGNTVDGRIYDIFQYDTKNDLHWSMNTLGGHTQKGIIPDNIWIHVCVTYSSGVSRMYVNGSQIWVNSNATSNFTFNKDYYVSYGYNQKICDFRIYDNALSPKEVHILSMGLWLHHTLSDTLHVGNKNLFNTSNGITAYNTGSISAFDPSMNGYTITSPVTTSSLGSGFNLRYGTYPVPYGSAYRVSAEVWVPSAHNIVIDYNNSPNLGAGNDNDNTSKRLANTFSIPANKWTKIVWGTENSRDINTNKVAIYPYDGVGLYTANDTASIVWKIRNIKFEIGSEATPYSLPANDPLANSKKLYDSSGYNYNGERIGNISIDSPSARNSYCASTSGNTGSSHSSNYIHISTKAASVDVFTVAGWVKYTNLGGYPTFLSASRESPQATGLWLCVNAEGHGLWAYVYDVKNEYLSYTSDPLLSSNTWYHFAFTFNKGKVQMFRNGVPVSNEATWNKTSVNLSNIYLFDSYTGSTWDTHFNGSLSDIRFYSKVLTQSEIKQLYDTPIHITNSGALLTQGEFVEVNYPA